MKVKLITPEEIEVGKDFTAKIVEVSEPVSKVLLEADNEPEVFLEKDGKKCWLENEATAVHYAGADWIKKLLGCLLVN